MNLLQITEPGRAEWREAPMPEPRAGEVLLRVSGVTTCPHWDLHILDGEPMFADRPLEYPYVPGEPGHEAVGHIEVLGEGVAGLEVGQRVAAWRDPGGRRQGCYAEYVAVEADQVLPVPDPLADADLASLELAMCVQVSFDQLLSRGPLDGKRVGITGLGPAGLIAVQMAKAYGAREVVAVETLERRRQLGASLGADIVLPPDPEEFPAGREGELACDVGLDTTGLAVAIEFLVQRTNETVAIFGVLREHVGFGPEHWWGGFALMGYGEHNRGAAERALELVTDGRLRLAPLVTHTLPFTRYAEGVELLRSKEAVKVLFTP
ncbi:MAG: zinc-dependent alcohol dehydrogenase family protein [Rubricoccaceae bacterium]